MRLIFLTMVVGILFMGCEECAVEDIADAEVTVCGNGVSGDWRTEYGGRSTEVLEEGTTLSFFARRGILAENKRLTLSEGAWRGGKALCWEAEAQEALVTAYCPTLPEAGNYYLPDGQLRDVLVCREDYGYREPVVLHFVHAMAKVVFKLGEGLNRQVKRLTLTPSVHLTGIEAYSGQTTVEAGGKGFERCFSQQADGCYAILVPPTHPIAVSMCLETVTGACYRTELAGMTCQQGHCYVANVAKKENQLGIYTAEDFIAFTHLINGKAYGGRSLEEFGEMSGERMTYRLKADIRFTEEERKRICQIGHSRVNGVLTEGFQEVFDGENHVLENLVLPTPGCDASGLFREVGKTGIVKDLTLRKVQILNVKPNISAVDFLCYKNSGRIDHCQLIEGSIQSVRDKNAGLVSYNHGWITNCSVQGLAIDLSRYEKLSVACGGIINQNQQSGQLLNSYATGITIKWKKKINAVSALCHYNVGVISNCYSGECGSEVHPLSHSNHQKVTYCHYPSSWKGKDVLGPETSKEAIERSHVEPYAHTPQAKGELVRKLNTWIEDIGRKEYPECLFLPWKVEAETTVTFDSLEDYAFFTRIESEQR